MVKKPDPNIKYSEFGEWTIYIPEKLLILKGKKDKEFNPLSNITKNISLRTIDGKKTRSIDIKLLDNEDKPKVITQSNRWGQLEIGIPSEMLYFTGKNKNIERVKDTLTKTGMLSRAGGINNVIIRVTTGNKIYTVEKTLTSDNPLFWTKHGIYKDKKEQLKKEKEIEKDKKIVEPEEYQIVRYIIFKNNNDIRSSNVIKQYLEEALKKYDKKTMEKVINLIFDKNFSDKFKKEIQDIFNSYYKEVKEKIIDKKEQPEKVKSIKEKEIEKAEKKINEIKKDYKPNIGDINLLIKFINNAEYIIEEYKTEKTHPKFIYNNALIKPLKNHLEQLNKQLLEKQEPKQPEPKQQEPKQPEQKKEQKKPKKNIKMTKAEEKKFNAKLEQEKELEKKRIESSKKKADEDFKKNFINLDKNELKKIFINNEKEMDKLPEFNIAYPYYKKLNELINNELNKKESKVENNLEKEIKLFWDEYLKINRFINFKDIKKQGEIEYVRNNIINSTISNPKIKPYLLEMLKELEK